MEIIIGHFPMSDSRGKAEKREGKYFIDDFKIIYGKF
jgi:hypothetical protein